MIAQTKQQQPLSGRIVWIAVVALGVSLILSAVDAGSSAFKGFPPHFNQIPIQSASLPEASAVSQFWNSSYSSSPMVRQADEVANRYRTSPSTRVPYALAVSVGTQPGYINTLVEYHPVVGQSQAQKWHKLVKISSHQYTGQTGWTTWTVTTNHISTTLSPAQALRDPFLTPLEAVGLKHHNFTTRSIQAQSPHRISVVADFVGSQVGPQKVSQFVTMIWRHR